MQCGATDGSLRTIQCKACLVMEMQMCAYQLPAAAKQHSGLLRDTGAL
jgi:hypothetical protein